MGGAVGSVVKGFVGDRASKRASRTVAASDARSFQIQSEARDAAIAFLNDGDEESLRIFNETQQLARDELGQAFDIADLETDDGISLAKIAAETGRDQFLNTLNNATNRALSVQEIAGQSAINRQEQSLRDAGRQGGSSTRRALGISGAGASQGDSLIRAGQSGLDAFSQSALDPNNPLFERRVAREQSNLDKLLAARGQFNSGAAIRDQVDLRGRLEAEEQQSQVGRQAQLASLLQPQVAAQQNIALQQAGLVANAGQQQAGRSLQSGLSQSGVIERIGQNQAGLVANQGLISGQQQLSTQNQLGQLALQGAQSRSNNAISQGEALTNLALQTGVNRANLVGQSSANRANVAQSVGRDQALGARSTGTQLARLRIQRGENINRSISEIQEQDQQAMELGASFFGAGGVS